MHITAGCYACKLSTSVWQPGHGGALAHLFLATPVVKPSHHAYY